MRGGYADASEDIIAASKDVRGSWRQERFDSETRHGCLQGHTSSSHARAWRVQPYADEVREMQVQRPVTEEGEAVSAFDLNEIQRPELLTSHPVQEGWTQDLCEELEKLCVASSIQRHPDDPDFALRIFELPIKAYRSGESLKKKETSIQLFTAPPEPHPNTEALPWAQLMCCPPQEILEHSLLRRAKLNWTGCDELAKKKSRGSVGLRPQNAAVNYPSWDGIFARHNGLFGLCWNCWIQDAPESFLEVDLGANCDVTYVSTLGRFPPVSNYPDYELMHSDFWHRESSADSACTGKHWPVVEVGRPGWGQWVTKYELHARLDGGKSWTTVGVLKGNSDMISEVAHDLRELCHNSAGLKCRYLRFLPQGYHGKPALRIGVYGIHAEKKEVLSAKQKEEERVKYLIPVPLTNRNRHRRQRDCRRRNGSPDYRGKYGADWQISRRRKKLAEATRVETKEVAGGQRCVLKRQDSAAYDSDAEAHEGDMEEETDRRKAEPLEVPQAPPAHRPPTLQRSNSRRVDEALQEQPALQRTRTNEERGYCSEPEELLGDDWVVL